MYAAIPLTRIEMDVCDWLLAGASPRTIALRLNMTEATVQIHLRNIFQKFHVASFTELAIVYLEHYSQERSKPKSVYPDDPPMPDTSKVHEVIAPISTQACWLYPDRQCYIFRDALQSDCYDCHGHRVCGASKNGR
jgi:DNA-binding CsgD family transcriptional regulator